MLKHGEINLLNVFNLRKLNHCPPHFSCVNFDAKTTVKQISDWIYENLTGRYWIGDVYVTDPSNNYLTIQKGAGFEELSEASFFALCLDQINKPDI
jgi:hypothetical protein